MGIFLRGLWKQKPGIYGPPSAVQRNIFMNAERAGIDPGSIALCMPMWGPGKQYSYGKTNDSLPIPGAFNKNYFNVNDNATFNRSDILECVGSEALTVVAEVSVLDDAASQGLLDTKRDSQFTSNVGFCVWLRHADGGGAAIGIGDKYFVKNDGPFYENNGFNQFCISWCTTEQQMYFNGERQSSFHLNDLNTNPISVSNYGLRLFDYYDGTTPRIFRSHIKYLYLFSSFFTPSQIAHLSDNPYFLLARNPARTWFVPTSAAISTYRQFAFRFRNDDGNETAATWKADQNTNVSLTPGSKVRVRVGVYNMNLFLDSASNRITTSDGNLFCVRTA